MVMCLQLMGGPFVQGAGFRVDFLSEGTSTYGAGRSRGDLNPLRRFQRVLWSLLPLRELDDIAGNAPVNQLEFVEAIRRLRAFLAGDGHIDLPRSFSFRAWQRKLLHNSVSQVMLQ